MTDCWEGKRNSPTMSHVKAINAKGKDKNRGRKHNKLSRSGQEVRIGETAFRPPLNLMRVGKSP